MLYICNAVCKYWTPADIQYSFKQKWRQILILSAPAAGSRERILGNSAKCLFLVSWSSRWNCTCNEPISPTDLSDGSSPNHISQSFAINHIKTRQRGGLNNLTARCLTWQITVATCADITATSSHNYSLTNVCASCLENVVWFSAVINIHGNMKYVFLLCITERTACILFQIDLGSAFRSRAFSCQLLQ